MKKGNLAKGLLGLALGVAMLLGGVAQAGDTITITGSTTVLPIAQKAAEVYMKKNPGVRISVAGTGSGDGIKSVIDGTADIGDASRDMKKKEVKLAEEKGVTPKKFTVALDCIVPVVNPANPVKDLSLAQLKDIYTGKIKNWKEVGGNDKTIVVISRDSSSGTFEVWNHRGAGQEDPRAPRRAASGQQRRRGPGRGRQQVRHRLRGHRLPQSQAQGPYRGRRDRQRQDRHGQQLPHRPRPVHVHQRRTQGPNGQLHRLRDGRRGPEDRQRRRLRPG